MYLYGASGHALVIADILRSMGLQVDGIFDDNTAVTMWKSLTVHHHWQGEAPMIVAIGNNSVRKMIAERLQCDFGLAIHTAAVVSPTATIAPGTVVMPGAIVNADAAIGRHCIINTGASVDHECVIGDYAHISPHATLCGNVHVGEGSWVGAGATVIPGVKIGRWCTIGAGAVVLNDVPDHATVVGCPARDIHNLTFINRGGVNRNPSVRNHLLPPLSMERA